MRSVAGSSDSIPSSPALAPPTSRMPGVPYSLLVPLELGGPECEPNDLGKPGELIGSDATLVIGHPGHSRLQVRIRRRHIPDRTSARVAGQQRVISGHENCPRVWRSHPVKN